MSDIQDEAYSEAVELIARLKDEIRLNNKSEKAAKDFYEAEIERLRRRVAELEGVASRAADALDQYGVDTGPIRRRLI